MSDNIRFYLECWQQHNSGQELVSEDDIIKAEIMAIDLDSAFQKLKTILGKPRYEYSWRVSVNMIYEESGS